MQLTTLTLWIGSVWLLRSLIKTIGAYAAWLFLAGVVFVRLIELFASIMIDKGLVTRVGTTFDVLAAANILLALAFLCRATKGSEASKDSAAATLHQ
jgi:hypothetical protein